MDINIPTTKDKIFKQYLLILNPILSTRRLTSIEIEVLSKLLYINYLYKALSKEQRDKILFHKETKERIRKSLNNISKNSLNNVFTSLRKKQLINKKQLAISVPFKGNIVEVNYKLILE